LNQGAEWARLMSLQFLCINFTTSRHTYFILHANDYERLKVDSKNVYFEYKNGRIFLEYKILISLTRVMTSVNEELIKLSQGDPDLKSTSPELFAA
jgi:hypothetical protein